MLAIRFGVQWLLLLCALLLLRRPILPSKGERLPLAVAGTIGYGSEAAFYFQLGERRRRRRGGGGRGGAASPLGMGLDRKAPPRALFLALALALIGSAFVVLGTGSAQVGTIGIVLALCTAFTYTAYLVGTNRHMKV